METRLITVDDLPHVRYMFTVNPTIEKKVFDSERIERFVNHLRDGMEKNETHVTMSFEDGIPLVMYVGYEYPKIGAWYIGLTKTTETAMHFKTSAKVMAPAFDLLAQVMENKGYYKVWMTATERNHNIRNMVMRKCSTALPKYDWYDEIVVPAGEWSGSDFYDRNRLSLNNDSSVVVRLFVLQQEYRNNYLKKKYPSYTGSSL